ncbi:MAG: helix-turn-helix domain-containing protein [Fimbriimonadaceae bacterium]|nr:helix-turn-helix domain-containing protein [Fimbriimonadaceae bacterium]
MALLAALDAAGAAGVGLREVAGAVGLKEPTARGLLATLEACGYVVQEPGTRRYGLGPAAVALGRRGELARLSAAAEGPLRALGRAVGETVLLAAAHEGWRHTLLTVESAQPLKVGAAIGVDDRFYTTATGRLLLSRLSREARAAVVGKLGDPGDHWPEAAAGWETVLARLRAADHLRYENRAALVVAYAVPVPWAAADLPAAVGLYLPAARDTAADREARLRLLREGAAAIAASCERRTA